MPGADPPARNPRGSGARMRRIHLLQELERAGMLAYLELERPAPSPNKTSTSFKIKVAGQTKLLTGAQVEAYTQGMLDAMRVLGKLPPGLEEGVAEILGR